MNKYEVQGIVGEGVYGVVLKCRNKETGAIVAIKRFKESEDDEVVRKTTIREVKILRLLQHENIVRLLEAFRRKGKLYLVFEYVDKNLLEILEECGNGIPAELVRKYTYQLVKAVEICHRNDIIHRDIKPENLLVSLDHKLKLCDFGFSRTTQPNGRNAVLTDYVATRWYRPPELLLGSTSYGKDIDIWAIGCIMGEMIDGQPFLPGESDIDQLFLTQKTLGALTENHLELLAKNPKFVGLKFPKSEHGCIEVVDRRYGTKICREGVDFMKKCLQIDPACRISAHDALNHPYFSSLREDDVGNRPQTSITVIRTDSQQRTGRSLATRRQRRAVKEAKSQSPQPNSSVYYANQSKAIRLTQRQKSKNRSIVDEDFSEMINNISKQRSRDQLVKQNYSLVYDTMHRPNRKKKFKGQDLLDFFPSPTPGAAHSFVGSSHHGAKGKKSQRGNAYHVTHGNHHGKMNTDVRASDDSPRDREVGASIRQLPQIFNGAQQVHGRGGDFSMRRGDSRLGHRMIEEEVGNDPQQSESYSYYKQLYQFETHTRPAMSRRPVY